jgi:hypothetical protein
MHVYLVYIVTITFMFTLNFIVVELGNLETYIVYFMVFQFFSVIAYSLCPKIEVILASQEVSFF